MNQLVQIGMSEFGIVCLLVLLTLLAAKIVAGWLCGIFDVWRGGPRAA